MSATTSRECTFQRAVAIALSRCDGDATTLELLEAVQRALRAVPHDDAANALGALASLALIAIVLGMHDGQPCNHCMTAVGATILESAFNGMHLCGDDAATTSH